MTRHRWLWVGGVVVAVAVAGAVVVSATSTPTVTVPTVAHAGPPPPSGAATPALATAVLAMGRLSDPANTFYELVDRPAGGSEWTLATPPGVADNGGLVVGASPSGALTAGFLPAADLTFSVLATRPAGSTTWAPSEIDGTVASEPDALAVGAGGLTAAVLRADGTPVVTRAAGATSWLPLVDAGALTAGAGGCQVTRITSVAVTDAGVPVVGARCTGTGVGIFVPSGAATSGSWTRIGPTLGASGVSAATVLRLRPAGTGIAALVEGSGQGRASVIGIWGDGGTATTVSVPLTVPSGWQVAATATGGGDGRGLAVLLGASGGGSLRLTGVAGPGQPWVAYATPPAGTTAVALVGTEVDAFVPSGPTLHVWSATGSGPWHERAPLTVPIQYGSSG